MREPPQIIVRAFDSEPCVLYALEMQPSGRHVNVSGTYPPPSYIGWPLEDAFDYDADLLRELQEAYSEGHRGALETLWAELRKRPRRFVDTLTRLQNQGNQ